MRHDTVNEISGKIDPVLAGSAKRIRSTLDRLYPDIQVPVSSARSIALSDLSLGGGPVA